MKSRTLANGVTLTVVGGFKPEISKDQLMVAFKAILALEPKNSSHEEWEEILESLKKFAESAGAGDKFHAMLMEAMIESFDDDNEG